MLRNTVCDWEIINHIEAMEESKPLSSTSTIAWPDKYFVEIIKVLINYATDLKLMYGVRILDAFVKVIVDHMVLPNYL